MSAKTGPNKNAILLTTATESRLLLPYVESLSLSTRVKTAVFAVGARANLEKLQAACPSSLTQAELHALNDVVWTLGWALAWGKSIATGFTICALGGSLEDATKAAKKLKLVVHRGTDFDALPRKKVESASFAIAADLADTASAKKKLALLPKAKCEEQLLAVERNVMGPEIQRRLVKICGAIDVGLELVSRLVHVLPEDADVAPLAGYDAPLRKKSIPESTVRDYRFNAEGYYGLVRRLVPLGGDFAEHAHRAARVRIEEGFYNVTEDVLLAAAGVTGDRDFVLNSIFERWVDEDQTNFMLFAPNLPGHVDPAANPLFLAAPDDVYTCVCAECDAYRMQVGTRRIVALAPFDALSKETKDLVKKVVRIKRCKPIVPILVEWAPSLANTSDAREAPKKKAADAPRTPHLDAAEAWLTKVQKAKTAASLKKLEGELDAFDNGDLIDEDAARWEELTRSVSDHRNTFPHGTKQHDILQGMIDTLSST